MISSAKRIVSKAVDMVLKQKAVGTHIYRPVVNAEKWAAWLVEAGVPNPVAAADMKVTIMTVVGNVQIVPERQDYVVRATSGVFCRIGDALCFAWYDFGWYDRHWAIRDVAGCEVCVHNRAVVVLSQDPGDFQFADEMLERAPASVVLGGEQHEATSDETAIQKSAPFTPSAATMERAKTALRASFDDANADPTQQAALNDLVHGKPVVKSQILDDLGPDLAAEIGVEGVAPAPVTEQKPEPVVAKTAPSQTKIVAKSNDERRMIYGWASVTTVDGESVVDLQDDEITTDALHDIAKGIVRGQRAGKFEHDGDECNETLEVMVFDKSLQEALGIDLGKEGLLVGQHVPDDAHWEKAKSGDWELSIAVRAQVEERA